MCMPSTNSTQPRFLVACCCCCVVVVVDEMVATIPACRDGSKTMRNLWLPLNPTHLRLLRLPLGKSNNNNVPGPWLQQLLTSTAPKSTDDLLQTVMKLLSLSKCVYATVLYERTTIIFINVCVCATRSLSLSLFGNNQTTCPWKEQNCSDQSVAVYGTSLLRDTGSTLVSKTSLGCHRFDALSVK